MKYVRTYCGIYDSSIGQIKERINEEGKLQKLFVIYSTCIHTSPIIDEAETIEELIRDDDILYIHDLYPDAVLVVEGNIKPFGYNDKITLKEWLDYNHVDFELYIKVDRDYKKVAERKPGEKLKLC